MACFQRAAVACTLVLMSFFVGLSQAKDVLVGGKTDAWKIPSSESSDSLNKWAEEARFLVGDSLVWKYDGQKDSVLQVMKERPFYFISGAQGHCEKGQKLAVVVLSQKHRYTGISPSPSPAEFDGPAVAPTSGASTLRGGFLVALGVLILGLF
ncbi:BLUE COPPER PROTEIN [Salix viminalis]|uniref:BLUE COPPER PROTEIN n=1 Tax=Salix viminalis TaxID=40686 RepID=A0A9Q0V8D6_SALVM|nr:BLUE COPPER PROTEIN [Salix viminalis]